jgi:shikimate dehydrogenase
LSGLAANKVLILGAGATAKNAILALTAAMPSADLHIKTRNQVKADSIAEWALRLGVPVQKVAGNAVLPEYELVISTLPPLSSTDGWFNGKPKGTLLDVAYNPWPSELAKQWLSSGGNVISGIEMLIWQAIAQIRVFRHGSVAEPLVNEEEIAKVMRAAALAEG